MNLLSIGGSDPSTGAGIQSDILSFSNMNAHPLTVITAITVQNTSKFTNVEPISPKIFDEQLESILEDFRVDGIKIGMVYNSKIIKIIYKKLHKLKIPIVIDPVIKSTTGGMLIEKKAIKDFQKYLIPLATVLTPNKYEAEVLSKVTIQNDVNLKNAAKILQKLGAKNIVITGLELEKNKITDFVLEKNSTWTITNEKISCINHGSGGNFSAIILCELTEKKTLKKSITIAKKQTLQGIIEAQKLGKGIPITNPNYTDKISQELKNAINKFVKIKGIYKEIPECQTNFVYSKKNPKSTKEILGIEGRIVKTGKKVTVAGELAYGGSKHVATSLLEVSKKFPEICCAINLKYQKSTIKKIRESGLILTSYDRVNEPKNVKINGSTIQWGTEHAIKNLKRPPDIIFHKGDFGKEPMIIIFDENPTKIMKKIRKITKL